MLLRKALLKDVTSIHKLVNDYAKRGRMLARALSEIYENLRDYHVAIERGHLIGVAGLHISWEDLAEIKSVAIKSSYQGKGLGTQLVKACITEGKTLGIKRFYTLTYVPEFFRRLGFKKIKRDVLPHKIWSECIKCPKFPNCDETALILEKDIKRQPAKRKGKARK